MYIVQILFLLCFYDYDALIAENNSLHAEINKLETVYKKQLFQYKNSILMYQVLFLMLFIIETHWIKKKDSFTKWNISTQNEITSKKQIEPITNDLQKKEIESQKERNWPSQKKNWIV